MSMDSHQQRSYLRAHIPNIHLPPTPPHQPKAHHPTPVLPILAHSQFQRIMHRPIPLHAQQPTPTIAVGCAYADTDTYMDRFPPAPQPHHYPSSGHATTSGNIQTPLPSDTSSPQCASHTPSCTHRYTQGLPPSLDPDKQEAHKAQHVSSPLTQTQQDQQSQQPGQQQGPDLQNTHYNPLQEAQEYFHPYDQHQHTHQHREQQSEQQEQHPSQGQAAQPYHTHNTSAVLPSTEARPFDLHPSFPSLFSPTKRRLPSHDPTSNIPPELTPPHIQNCTHPAPLPYPQPAPAQQSRKRPRPPALRPQDTEEDQSRYPVGQIARHTSTPTSTSTLTPYLPNLPTSPFPLDLFDVGLGEDGHVLESLNW